MPHTAPTPEQPGKDQPVPPPVLLYTPAQAAEFLTVPESWLRRRVGARLIPCTFVGKHLRFSAADIAAIADAGQRPVRGRIRRAATTRPR
jgi:excisionase family DNA binding protein